MGMGILLIDDDPFALTILSQQLRVLGFRDLQAHECARQALAALEDDCAGHRRIGLVLCDLQMPEMDGVEFVRHLERVGYTGGLILVSGEDERVLRSVQRLARAHQLQVLGSLRKPVSTERLARLLGARHARPAPRAGRKTYAPEALRRAIAGGDLVTHYQPKVCVASGELAGVETLVRWRHPEDGIVYPDNFISLAEEHGLIDELTHTVLHDALLQARRWQDAGLALKIAVNVSMVNLTTLAFPDFVASSLREAGLPLTRLVLEVTESRLMSNPLASLDILARLRLKHIGLSIDDFGTGHSSLAQLRDVPFDELKVDRSFVHGAARDASQRAILEASLGMADQLGLQTVAEGVEEQEDWDFLRGTGCNLAQGYFIAPPMPPEELIGWKVRWDVRRGQLGAIAH